MDQILAEAGIKTVLAGIRMPRMSPIVERWVQSCRRELLYRCLPGTNATYGTLYASTNTSTTSTEPTQPSTKPPRSVSPRTRSQTPGESPT
ncbi:hypothetical protein [Nonomuraea jabiensis]|uniref:hypothetical protein n=1 Tax=Nonomuraea jabiensis TaxID=882448 RepID=UPI0036C94FE9